MILIISRFVDKEFPRKVEVHNLTNLISLCERFNRLIKAISFGLTMAETFLIIHFVSLEMTETFINGSVRFFFWIFQFIWMKAPHFIYGKCDVFRPV